MTPYTVFGLLSLIVWVGVLVLCPKTRLAQVFLSVLGLIGGPILDLWVFAGFWHPEQPWMPLGSMLFGAGFIGVVTASTLCTSGSVWRPRPQRSQPVSRAYKLWTLGGIVIGIVIAAQAGLYAVIVMSIVWMVGAMAIMWSRADLDSLIWRGVRNAVIAYTVLMGTFLFGLMMAGQDPLALAQAYAPFYVTHGPVVTSVVVLFFSATFGAFVGPLYPWGKNLYRSRA